MSLQKKIARNATYNFLVKAVGLAFGFAASVIVARFLGPENYGIYSLVIWLLGTIGLLVNLGIPTTITKYVSEYVGRKDLSAVSLIFSRLLRFEIASGALVSVLLFLLAQPIARWYDNPDLTLYLRVASLVILPMGLMWLYNGLFFGLQRFDLIALINLVVSPATLVIILVVLYSGGKIEWLVAVSAMTNLLLVASYVYLKRARFPFVQKGGVRNDFGGKLLKFSASVFMIVVLEAIVWERFGIFFLSIFSTPSEIAFYNVAFIFSSRTMILLPGALTGILLPAMSEVYGVGDKAELARVHVTATRYLAMLSLPLCLGGIAISRQLFATLYGPSFGPASLVFAILIVGGAVGSIATASSSLLYGAELQRVVVRVGILAALINILASWFLVPILAARGAALAAALTQIVGGVLLLGYVYGKYMKQAFPILPMVRTLLASALMGCAAFVLAEAIGGWIGLIAALALSLPLYVFNLFLTRSLTSGDVNLLDSAIRRLPTYWGKAASSVLNALIKRFYPSR